MEVAAAAGATITCTTTMTRIHEHTGEMTTKVAMTIGEIEVAHTGLHGTKEDEIHGALAPPLQTHVTVIGA